MNKGAYYSAFILSSTNKAAQFQHFVTFLSLTKRRYTVTLYSNLI